MTTATERPDAAPREGLLARHPLVSFFLLTFVFSWVYWGLWKALQLPESLFVVGAAGPTVSAFIVLAIISGKPGVLGLLRSYVHWRVGVQWYLVTLIGFPVLMLLAFVVLPGSLADFVAPDWSFVPFYLSQFAFTLFVPPRGPLLEEGGWRGFALPRLQRLHGPLMGTLILGVLWGLWHGPFYLGPLSLTGPDATFVSTGIAFVEYLIGATGFAVVMTWVFNNTGGSVLMAILLHTSIDVAFAFAVLFPSAKTDLSPSSFGTLGIAIAASIAALVIIVATRGELSYERYQREVELPARSATVR
jgi:membrane protease YdiL (CAAX protease family)